MTAYEELLTRFKKTVLIDTSKGNLFWDMETYMPPRGIGLRSEQMGALSEIAHHMATDPEIGTLLDKAGKDEGVLDDAGKRNLFLMRKAYNEQTKLPERLVGDLTRQEAIATDTWKKAKAGNDWKLFEPELQKLVDLNMEKADLLKTVKGASTLYDAMIDDFEPKMTADEISTIFSELRDGLIPLIKDLSERSSRVDGSFLTREIPLDIQRLIATDLCGLIGYDISSDKGGGRIDEVEHPFTSGYFDDVRITVKYHVNKFDSAVFAILHEGGHALYEQHLKQDWKFQPIGMAASYGIHESESRFVENMIGRTPEFWEFYYPRLDELTGNAFSDIPLSIFCRAINLVTPSKIRIEADEVTYSLHIIIRFEIERDLFTGRIKIPELPEIWNQKYKAYLGIDPGTDTEGILQDTHWGSGLYGYFPSYALGNIFDGMWFEQMKSDMPEWAENLADGKISDPIQWHINNIHSRSNLYDPKDLVRKVIGKELTAKPFLRYLNDKYKKLF